MEEGKELYRQYPGDLTKTTASLTSHSQIQVLSSDRVPMGLTHSIRAFSWILVDKRLKSVSIVYFFSTYENVQITM